LVVFDNLRRALPGRLSVKHVFSCESDPKKRKWILDNFPSVTLLFGDVKELHTGMAMNYVTGKREPVPAVDIVVAGFVCKSVSIMNSQREQFQDCIRQAKGQTGETFQGVVNYVKVFQPRIVICENVRGLTYRNKGCEPLINHVRSSFENMGYAFDSKVLDSRDYFLPHRRLRCWMWGFRGLENKDIVKEVTNSVVSLASKQFFDFRTLFRWAGVPHSARRKINQRERDVLDMARSRVEKKDRRLDMIVDISKTAERAPACFFAVPCLLPNSLLYRVNTGCIMTPEQMLCLQGIYGADFPALKKYAKTKGPLVRDLAGNAFSTPVFLAVLISILEHLPT
jgi:site-specific DNA-cytosine methylase